MHTGNLHALTTAAARRRSAGSAVCVRRAAAYAIEGLERRVLLSAAVAPGGDDFLNRFHSHDLTPAELDERDWVSLNWNGERVYAKENEWIVRLDLARGRGADTAGLIRRLRIGATVEKTLGRPDVALVDVPRGVGFQQLAAGLSRLGVYVNVEPNQVLTVAATPNDPQYPTQWHYNNTGQSGGTPDADVDAPEAWDLTTGSASVVAAVIDTGIDYNHVDLSANLWQNTGEINNNGLDDDSNGIIDDYYGADFINDDGDPWDDHSHGTHVSGTIAAVGNNGVGVTGVAWTAKVMSVKVFDSGGWGTTADVVDGLNYVINLKNRGVNVKVTNNSYGVPSSFELEQAVQSLSNLGVLFVAAAGNSRPVGLDNDVSAVYPANYVQPNVISVAATTHTDTLAWFSHYGVKSVHLGAPGENVYSTYPGDLYASFDGTSMAAPHVVGAAVLGWSYNASADMAAVKAAILQGADRVNALHGITQTGARLNARGTLDLLRAPRTVNGTSGNDTMTVQPTSGVVGSIDVVLNGVVQYSGPAANVSWLRLLGFDGDDTITVNSNIRVWAEGGNGNDSITGGNGNDFLYGNEGNDTLNGHHGHDRLEGGTGADVHRGDGDDNGNDDLVGGIGNDTYLFGYGSAGIDAITTEPADADVDTVSFAGRSSGVTVDISQAGTRRIGTAAVNQTNPTLVLYIAGTGTEIENVIGSSMADTLRGNSRNNTLSGSAGNDLLNAGAAPDGSDTYAGGSGTDTVTYQERFNNLNLSLDGSANDGEAGELDNISGDVENVTGGAGNDSITGNALGNVLSGRNGSDTLSGAAGYDRLIGNAGDDVLWGGADNDTADYREAASGGITVSIDGAFNDVDGDGGTDYIGTDIENVTGSAFDDSITGSDSDNLLMGLAGNDTIRCGGGADYAYGGAGDDVLWGDAGMDRLHGENGNDVFHSWDNESDTLYGGAGIDNADDRDPDPMDVLFDIP